MRQVISICGGSGTGKSTLAKALVEEIGKEKAVRLPTDYFLTSNPYITNTQDLSKYLKYDWELVDSLLANPNGAKISIPDFDFTVFKRKSLDSDWKISLREVILLDSMVPYPNADLTVFIELDDETRRERIIERDKRNQSNVIENWEAHQQVLSQIKVSQHKFDLVLDGNSSVADNVGKVIELLHLAIS